jgi:hypothetical protein
LGEFEQEVEAKIIEIGKKFEKNSLGDKELLRKELKKDFKKVLDDTR